MANKSFSAAEGVIAESAKIVDQTRADLKKQIADLSDKMDQVKQYWQGQGSNSFHGVKNAWTTNAQDVIDVLDIFEQNLRSNEATYQANEQGASDRLSKYTSQLKH